MSPVFLTPRDHGLLEALYDFGLLTTPQLERKVFGRIRRTTSLRRLRKLEKRGLIARSAGLEKGTLAWSVTTKGGSLIGRSQGYGHVNRNTLEHDILVSEIRLIFEEIGASSGWKSGHLIKKRQSSNKYWEGVVPDGILLLPLGESIKPMAIEVELTTKASGRYVNVLREYAMKKSVVAVWYIVSHKTIAKAVMKALASRTYSGRNGDWVFWTPLDEVLKDPLQIQLRSKTKSIWLQDLVPSIRARTTPAQAAAQRLSNSPLSKKNESHANPLNTKGNTTDEETCNPSLAPLTIRGFKGDISSLEASSNESTTDPTTQAPDDPMVA